MKVRNKLTGATTDHVRRNNETILTLVKLGVLEIVDDTPEPGEMIRTGNGAVLPAMERAPQPRWSVAQIPVNHVNTRRVVAIVFEVGITVHEAFTGEPETIKSCGGRFSKANVPADILKEYARAYKEFYGKLENQDLLRYTQGY